MLAKAILQAASTKAILKNSGWFEEEHVSKRKTAGFA